MKASLNFIMVCTLAGGIAIGVKWHAFNGNRGIATAVVEDSPRKRVTAATFYQRSAMGSGMSAEQRDAVRSRAIELIDQMRETSFEGDFMAALGNDAIGSQVARGLVAGRHPEVVGASELANEFFTQLKGDPKSGMEIVREALHRIPEKGFEADRTTLLQTASTLRGMEKDASDLAVQEFNSNIVEATEAVVSDRAVARALLVATAYRIFIDLSSDPSGAYSGTIQGIVNQQDSAIRRTMIDKFLNKYPDLRDDLQRELAERQIDPYHIDVPQQVPQEAGSPQPVGDQAAASAESES